MMREMLDTCCQNQLKFSYVLADIWFCSTENMNHIYHKSGKHFVMGCKSNRKVSLSLEDKMQGRSQRIDAVDFSEDKPVKAWMSGHRFSYFNIQASV